MTKRVWFIRMLTLGMVVPCSVVLAQTEPSDDLTSDLSHTDAQYQYLLLEEVYVTGGRDSVRTLTGSATLIDEEQILEFDDTDITDLLGRSPGVYVRLEDGYGLRPNIGIRGAAAERSQKITIMEDGILIAPAPYSAPAAYYLPNVNRMSAVEVFKGPSAIRYGPHTVGGALNFVTAPVPTARSGSLNVAYGSDNYQKYRATFGDTVGRLSYLLDGLRYSADGFKQLDGGGDTGFVRDDINAKLVWKSAPESWLDQRAELKVGYAQEESDETYLGLTDADFETEPDRRYRASALDLFDSEHSQVHLLYTARFKNGVKLISRAYFNQFERSWNKFDGIIGGPSESVVLARPDIFPTEIALLRGEIDSDEAGGQLVDVTNNDRTFDSNGIEVSARHQFAWGAWNHEWVAGMRFHHDSVERDHHQRGYFMLDGELVFDQIDTRDKKALNEANTDALAFYMNDRIALGDWEITLGFRVERIEREFDDFLTNVSATQNETVVLPGAGVFWQWTPQLGLFAGVNAGFSPAAPSASDGVDSEESINFEYGLRYDNGFLLAEVVGFFSDYDNLIGRCRVSDDGCEVGEEFSAGAVEVGGTEIMAQYQWTLNSGWRLPMSLTYTYTESAFQSSFLSQFSQWGQVIQGDELPYTPAHQGRLQLGLMNDQFAFNAAIKHTSQFREVAGQGGYEPGLSVGSLTTLDIAGSWSVNEDWTVRAAIENVLDEREIVSRRPFGARPSAPRNFKLGFEYNF